MVMIKKTKNEIMRITTFLIILAKNQRYHNKKRPGVKSGLFLFVFFTPQKYNGKPNPTFGFTPFFAVIKILAKKYHADENCPRGKGMMLYVVE
jgi:hypothetical protein